MDCELTPFIYTNAGSYPNTVLKVTPKETVAAGGLLQSHSADLVGGFYRFSMQYDHCAVRMGILLRRTLVYGPCLCCPVGTRPDHLFVPPTSYLLGLRVGVKSLKSLIVLAVSRAPSGPATR